MMPPEPPRWLRLLLGGLEPIMIGIAIAAPVVVGVGLALTVGTTAGLVGYGALATGFVLLYCVGVTAQEVGRSRLRNAAFLFRGSAVDAHPTESFFIRPWHGRSKEGDLPPFVWRHAMAKIMAGLSSKRFVIVKGRRGSGISRLIYEVALKLRGRIVLVAERMGVPSEDPLMMLMRDPRGFASEEPQVLILRDFAARLIAGSITAEFIRDWLLRHPHVSIVATLTPDDVERIKAQGEEAEATLESLEGLAATVRVSPRLKGSELVDARKKFPGLSTEQLELLPLYLVSADPLRERFVEAEIDHPLGRAIVQAVADWQRAGGTQPAPEDYVRAVAQQYLGEVEGADFDAELAWALESVRQSAGLIYSVEVDGHAGYRVDDVVIDLLDDRETGAEPCPVPDFAWEAVEAKLTSAIEGNARDHDVASDLVALAEAALARGRPQIAIRILRNAARMGGNYQHQRIVQILSSAAGAGSAPQSLVNSRRGDGIIRRLGAVEDLAHARNTRPRHPHYGDEGEAPSPFFAWIYRRTALRTFVRLGVLGVGDAFSAAAGLAAGLFVQALVTADFHWSALAATFTGSVAPWSAIAVLALALVKLYRQDSPRARLGSILLAMAVLGGVGFVGALAEGFDVLTALLAGVAAWLGAAWIDYRLRIKYDDVSRAWVKEHGLEARTLVIGTAKQAAMVERALEDLSRPTVVVGFITSGAAPVAADGCLGSVDDLAKVALTHCVGRVLIADPDMSSAKRQELADCCHLQGLRVEAVPSLTDIRAGSAGFVAGQSLVLISMEPLWQSDSGFFAKRALDVCVSLLAVALFWPVIIVISLVTLATTGGVITRSWRPGLAGSVFGMYRFRTTARHATVPGDPSDPDGDAGHHTTAFGGWLRNRGLDELPQLLNVMLGEMSLVGPRPLRIADHTKLKDEHLLRYVVRPGVTSPRQVGKRSALSHDDLASLDVAYLRHWTILVDLEILVKTARLMIRGRPELPTLIDEDDVGSVWLTPSKPVLSVEVNSSRRRRRIRKRRWFRGK